MKGFTVQLELKASTNPRVTVLAALAAVRETLENSSRQSGPIMLDGRHVGQWGFVRDSQ